VTASARAVALTVRDVIVETPDARSIVFEHPETRWSYLPGQFLTLRIPGPDETSFARCYSLASAPGVDSFLKVTVKRVDGGYASNWICDELKPGHTIEVLPPAGTFTPTRCADGLLLFAGGSGITPMMSIIKSVLVQVRGSVVLIYANRDERSVIFRNELKALAASHPARLQVIHWLDSVQGVPEVSQLAELARTAREAQCFICGPGPFMDAAVEALHGLEFPSSRVHVERFVSLPDEEETPSAPSAAEAEATATVQLEVHLDGATQHIACSPQESLLDAMLRSGIKAPHSCKAGACASCMCTIETGKVRLRHNEVLDKNDLAQGWTLACQAMAESEAITVRFPD